MTVPDDRGSDIHVHYMSLLHAATGTEVCTPERRGEEMDSDFDSDLGDEV